MASPPNPSREDDRPVRDEDLRAWMVLYGPALRRYFLKKASASEAEDLVQDVFLAMQSRGAGAAIENVEGYLFRTAANVLGMRRSAGPYWTTNACRSPPSDGMSGDAASVRGGFGDEAIRSNLTGCIRTPQYG